MCLWPTRTFASSIKFNKSVLRYKSETVTGENFAFLYAKSLKLKLRKFNFSEKVQNAKVISIIDCLEIQIEKPSNPVHQSLTWSQYKNCNTIKYLISCNPDGLVNYISQSYGGRVTDVTIVEDCGYLHKLTPGSHVMADRGFKNIAHFLQQRRCTLVRPPFVQSGIQSSKEEVKQSNRIAALRIHMLNPHACTDHNLIQYIDFIIVIACGIINV